jgi:hypothetical protein
MLIAYELARVVAVNLRACAADITHDEILQIARLYVRLHNRLYPQKWDEERYLREFWDTFVKSTKTAKIH